MAMVYATVEEVEAGFRTLSDDEEMLCSALLAEAGIVIDAYNQDAPFERKQLVSCRMVRRQLDKVTVEGDSNSGVKVENIAQEGDPVKYKVSLEDKVQVGNVTIEGSTDNGNKIGEITGLTNTTLNSADFATTGRAATEEQLKSVMDTLGTVGSVDLSAGENIQIDKLGNNDYKVSLKDDISLNSIEAKEYKVGNETYIDSNGINANNKTISNVAPGRVDATSTDAVNGSQLYQVKQDIQGLSNDISRFGEEIDSVGALSAAMAGLHPRFQDGNKGELAMAMGSYDGKNALAVGGFYAPNQEVMFSLGMGITQGGKKMGNIARPQDLWIIRAKPARTYRRWSAWKTLTNFTSGSPARSSRPRRHAAWTAASPSARRA